MTGKTLLFLRAEDATYAEFNVRSQTLDEFFRASGHRIESSSFALWIDAEGAADKVLAGAEAVLRSVVAIFVEVEGYPFWKGQRWPHTLLNSSRSVASSQSLETENTAMPNLTSSSPNLNMRP